MDTKNESANILNKMNEADESDPLILRKAVWAVNTKDGSGIGDGSVGGRIWNKIGDGEWTQLSGDPRNVGGGHGWRMITSGMTGVFAVSYTNDVYYRIGTNTDPYSAGTGWQLMPNWDTWGKSLSSGRQTVWGVDQEGEIYYMKIDDMELGDDGKWKLNDSNQPLSYDVDWENVWEKTSGPDVRRSGRLKQISCSSDGPAVWGVAHDKKVYFLRSADAEWGRIPGVDLDQISVGKLGVFGVKNGEMQYRIGTHNTSHSTGTSWQRLSYRGFDLWHVAVSDNTIYGMSETNTTRYNIWTVEHIRFTADGNIQFEWKDLTELEPNLHPNRRSTNLNLTNLEFNQLAVNALPNSDAFMVARNNLHETIGNLYPRWTLFVDIRPYGTVPGWSNILQVGVGGNNHRYGDRIPGIWFHSNSTRLHIACAIDGNKSFEIDPEDEIPMDEWTRVSIIQLGTNNRGYNIVMMVGNNIVCQMRNNGAREFRGVKAYTSNDHSPAAKAYIRRLRISTTREERCSIL